MVVQVLVVGCEVLDSLLELQVVPELLVPVGKALVMVRERALEQGSGLIFEQDSEQARVCASCRHASSSPFPWFQHNCRTYI